MLWWREDEDESIWQYSSQELILGPPKFILLSPTTRTTNHLGLYSVRPKIGFEGVCIISRYDFGPFTPFSMHTYTLLGVEVPHVYTHTHKHTWLKRDNLPVTGLLGMYKHIWLISCLPVRVSSSPLLFNSSFIYNDTLRLFDFPLHTPCQRNWLQRVWQGVAWNNFARMKFDICT